MRGRFFVQVTHRVVWWLLRLRLWRLEARGLLAREMHQDIRQQKLIEVEPRQPGLKRQVIYSGFAWISAYDLARIFQKAFSSYLQYITFASSVFGRYLMYTRYTASVRVE